jgi:ribonuclease-3
MDAPSLDDLAERLGIVLREPDLIRQAFVHSSYYNENPSDVPGHNERLEFYGDAVIGLAVSRLLYERYPDEDEGFLTARRAALVNREALAAIALSMNLDRYLKLGRGEADAGGATRPSVLAAAFEALAGALSLTEGHDRTDEVLVRLFEPSLEALNEIDGPPKSAKSRLQELTQRQLGVKPSYQVTATSGPPHEQQFEVAVQLDGKLIAVGSGSSRQRAEEQAAAEALDLLRAAAAATADAADGR